MGISPGGPVPAYLSVKEAATVLGLSLWQVYRLIRAGRLPAERLAGGGWRVPRSSLNPAEHGVPHRVSLEQIYELLIDIRRLLGGGPDAGRCECCGKPTSGRGV